VGEQKRGLLGSGDADDVSVGAQGAIVKSGKCSNAVRKAGAGSQRPEDALRAKLQFAVLCFGGKALNIRFGSASKEKQLVEVALAGQLGFAEGKAGVLRQFARREGAKSNDIETGVLREGFQGIAGGGERFGCGNTREPSEAHGGGRALVGGSGRLGTQVEIAFRHANDAAVLGNEGMLVAETAARLVELEARAPGEPDGGNAGMIEGGGELVEARNALAARGDERIYGNVKDAGSLAQARLRRVRSILAEIDVGGLSREVRSGEVDFVRPGRLTVEG